MRLCKNGGNMMKLYKMELYKICCRKIFIWGLVCVLLVFLLAFWIQVADERATVDGVTYTGYRAAQINKEITEEFKGVLTDEKVTQIIEKYGFPGKVEQGWGYFRDANFLNEFVLDYLSNGYIRDWNDYKIATDTYAIADCDLGKVAEITGKEIVLEYYHGWKAFLEVLAYGMIAGSVLLLFSLSSVFANESQTKMLPLLFTSKEGRRKDIPAKIAAAFTVAIAVWSGIVLLNLLLCGIVFGLDGLHCYNGMVTGYLFSFWQNAMIPMNYYIIMVFLCSFIGMFSLCAITICISALNKNSFHAVVAAAVCWGLPVLLCMFAGGFYGAAKILAAAPVFMVIYRVIEDINNYWNVTIGTAVIVSVLCITVSYRKYYGRQSV